MSRRYRKQNSLAGIIKDTVDICSKSSWISCLLFGFVTFAILYFLLPAWYESHAQSLSGNRYSEMLQPLFSKLVRGAQWVGITCGLVSLFFSARNYFYQGIAGKNERTTVSFISKILGRWLN